MTWLWDTNVLSELARPSPNAGVLTWASSASVATVSVVTLEEIAYGLAWRPNPRIRTWFEQFTALHCSILPITSEIALRCGQLRGELAARGATRSQADMLIAATAQVHALTVVTRNVRDFEGCMVPVLNPFT